MLFPTAALAAQQEISVNDNVLQGVNRFEYDVNWRYNPYGAPNQFNQDLHNSNTPDSSLAFHFVGTQVKLYGVKANYFGIAAVSMDGGAETMVDFYSPTIVDQPLMYLSPALSNGSHTLRVRVTGNKNNQSGGIYVLVDRAVVTTLCDKARGDANCDGSINLADFETWRQEFIGEITTKLADFNGDNVVNLVDFEAWRQGFNTGV